MKNRIFPGIKLILLLQIGWFERGVGAFWNGLISYKAILNKKSLFIVWNSCLKAKSKIKHFPSGVEKGKNYKGSIKKLSREGMVLAWNNLCLLSDSSQSLKVEREYGLHEAEVNIESLQRYLCEIHIPTAVPSILPMIILRQIEYILKS